jgi:hypothetical protein
MCKIPNQLENRPTHELQDIFNLYGDEYIKNHKLTSVQKKAITDIRVCRTSALGYNARECCECSHVEFAYNSCRNRNCPKCQGLKRFKWIEDRLKTTIDVPYYHTVFTVQNQLFDIAIYNQKIFYDLLFKSASDTLKLFGRDSKYWDMKDIQLDDSVKPKIDLAFFGILHTWGQTLVYHPHIHFIVAGAGIIDEKIVEPKYNSKFLFPVKAMSKVFRGKLIEGIKKAYYKNELQLDDRFNDSRYFESFIDNVVKRKWVVYAKSQFKSSQKIVEYMSRYTHRSAISNSRIISIDDHTIRFSYRDYKDNNKIKILKVTADEFIKRFLYHIPPKRYYRIRYYGAIQRLPKIKNEKIVTIEEFNNQETTKRPTKPKCKKCQSSKSETIVVVDGNQKVVQGLMTQKIISLKKERKINDSS